MTTVHWIALGACVVGAIAGGALWWFATELLETLMDVSEGDEE